MQTQFNGNLINVVAPTFQQQVNGDTHSLFNESVLNEVHVASANPSFNILQNNPPLMINPNNFNRLDDLDLLFQMDDEFFQKNDMSFDVDPCSSDAYLLSKSGVSRDALTFWINEGAFDDEIESAKMMSYKEQEERVALSTTDSSSILIRANIALNIFKKNPDGRRSV